MSEHAIYGLSERPGEPLRYVGVTTSPVDVRVTQHLARARRAVDPTAFQVWLLQLAARPVFVTLSTATSRAEGQAAERSAIAEARARGEPLLNGNAGGQLRPGEAPSAGGRARIARDSRARWQRDRDGIVAAQRAGKRRPEARARQSAAKRRDWARPGVVRHQSLAHARRLTEDQVRRIKVRLSGGEMPASIARGFGVTPNHITCIKLGRIWRHVTTQSGGAAEVGYVGL